MTSAMKVLYVINATTPAGGANKSLLAMLDGLTERGITPVVVAPDAEGICHSLHDRGIETHALPFRPNTFPRLSSAKDWPTFLPKLAARRLVNAKAAKAVARLCIERGVELVHSNVSVVDIGFRAAMTLGLPHVYHFREFADLDFGMHYFHSWRAFHKAIDRPLSYSICITRGIASHHGLSGARARVIYNGIANLPHPAATVERKRRFLFAGRIEPAKGLAEAVQAYCLYAKQTDDPAQLAVAGEVTDAAYFQRIKAFISDNGLDANIAFLGERSDVAQLMQESIATIVASRFEAFGRTTAEAMACGCLVIGHDTGGTREQFDNGLRLTGEEIGLRYTTVEQLAEHLHAVADAPVGSHADMECRARLTVERLYSTDANVESVFNFYKDITDQCNKQ